MRSLKLSTLALLVILIVLLLVNVFMRYILRLPIEWTEEAGQLLLIWITFLGAAMAAGERRHMAMDALQRSLPPTVRRYGDIVIGLIVVACLVLVMFYGWQMTAFNVSRLSESLRVSYALFYAAVPVGALFYAVFELAYLRRAIFSPHSHWPFQGLMEAVD